MKINIKKEILEKALSHIIGVVEKRQTLPILGNVFIRLENNRLTLIGSDLESEITMNIDDINGENGSVTVSAKKIFDICRSLPNESEINISVPDNKMLIRSLKSRFTLQTLKSDEFPKLEELSWKHQFQLSQKELHHLLSKTSFSMAQQDVRYFLNGLLFEINNNIITSVATDGHRLAKTSIEVDGLNVDFEQSVLPRKAVLEITKFLNASSDEKIDIQINNNHISIKSNNFLFTSKLIDGRFPDYEKVIPVNLDKHIILNRTSLIDILSRAAILSNEKFRGVSLHFKQNILTVASHNPEQERATDEIDINYKGDDIEIGFNVTYLMDALKACQSEFIDLGLLDSSTSCTFHADDSSQTLYLIMPMKI